jgi:hypothetical protein
LAFNNFVLFDRVHLPIIGKRAAVVEEDLLSVRESARARSARIRSNQRRAAIRLGCGMPSQTQSAMQSATRNSTAARTML